MIDKKSPIPVYYQLKQDIERKINEGLWKVGQCIDSERELSDTYGVSRMTIRQALGELVNEGILIREKGRGTFVCEPKLKQRDIMSFSAIIEKMGMTLENKVLKFEVINTPDTMEDIFPFDKLYKIDRIRIVDGECIANEIVYIPCDYCGYLDEEMMKGSLFNILKKFGYDINHSEAFIQAVLCNDKYRKIFNADCDIPLLKNVSRNIDESGKVIFFEEAVYRSDKYILEVNISKKEGRIK